MGELSLKEKTAKGLFWGGISNGVQQLLGMIFGIYLGRILNAEDYGLVGMLAIFSGIASIIINSGFTVALTNKQNVTQKDYNAVFWFTFFVGLFCYLVLFFSAPLIANFYGRPELINLSRVIFLSFFLSGTASVSYTVLFKNLMVKQQAKIDIIAMGISGLVGVILAYKGFAYWALAIQSVVFVGGGAILRIFVSPWRPTLELDFSPLKSMFSFSIKLFFTNIIQQINSNVFSVLLGRFYNASEVGFYTQGNKWMVMAMQPLSGMINMVAQPVLVEVKSESDRQIQVFRKMIRFGAFVSFPAMLGLAFVAKEFIFVTIGEKWFPSVIILQIMCLWGACSFLYTLYTQILIVCGRSDIYLYGNVLQGILQVVFVLLVLKWGIVVMASVYVCIYLLSLLFWAFYVKKEIGLPICKVVQDIIPYLGATLVSFVLVWVLTSSISNMYILLATKILLSVSIYVCIMWLCGSTIFKDFIIFIRRKK